MNAKLFLIAASFALFPIALMYGLFPQLAFQTFWAVEIVDKEILHVMRGIMGLYLGVSLLWLLGFKNQSIRIPALYTLVFFSFGIAFGRVLSLVLDGIPHWLFIFFLLAEILLGGIGYFFLKKEISQAS